VIYCGILWYTVIYCGILWYIFLQGEESVVTCSDETRHNFQSGDYVTFSEVQVGLCVSLSVALFVCVLMSTVKGYCCIYSYQETHLLQEWFQLVQSEH